VNVSREKLSVEDKGERAAAKRFKSQRERMAIQREVSAAKKAAGLTHHVGHRETEAEMGWRRQLPFMPSDTRNLTARVCGDPLPGRSALDRRSA
jgi:hypothetical protein